MDDRKKTVALLHTIGIMTVNFGVLMIIYGLTWNSTVVSGVALLMLGVELRKAARTLPSPDDGDGDDRPDLRRPGSDA